jgi:DNA-binding winged helix-turn-helix (wHTH) protein/tetratricopeptide (TPR) repeat protein
MEYLFGEFTLDLARQELRRGSEPVAVEPQVFDLLVYLVQNRHRVVSKDDLVANVWGGRIVSDSTLISRISAARKAVGDRGDTQILVRTIPRKGIRFVGDVRVQSDASEPILRDAAPVDEPSHLRPAPPAAGRAHRPVTTRQFGWIFAAGLAAVAAILLPDQLARPTPAQTGVEGTDAADRGIDPESYEQFLRAKALVHQRRASNGRSASEGLAEAIELLEPVVARYPDFGPGWARLALAYLQLPGYEQQAKHASVAERRRDADEWLTKAKAAAERAIALNPRLPEGYAALGKVLTLRGRLVQAEEVLSKAQALDPFAPETLQGLGNLLGAVARTEEALDIKQTLLKMEPFVVAYNGGVRDMLWTSGQTETLIARLSPESAVDLSYIAQIYSVQGRYAEAADALMAIPPGTYPEGMVEEAARLLRAAQANAASPQDLPRLGDRLDFVYIYAGAPERTLERFEDDVAAGIAEPNIITRLWSPIYAPVRKTDRFRAFARDAGLVDYWRARGWPKFCRPTTAEDFICE